MGKKIAGGLRLPEAARWHDGAFWFSDIFGFKVHRVAPGGNLETIAEFERPSGLGWLPDGHLLVVSMLDQKLLRLEGGKLVEHADMSGVAKHWCNDMVVDSRGRAYVGCTGGIPLADMEIIPAPLLVVDPDGTARVAAPDLMFPNGVVVSADNKLLYVAESGANRVTRFDVADDGSLSNPTLHAQLQTSPDGMAIDANDEIWVAEPQGSAVLHLGADGSVVQRLDLGGLTPLACALGGVKGDQLMVCVVPEMSHSADIKPNSWIEVFEVGSRAPGF